MPRLLSPVRACTRCGSSTNEFGKCSKVSDGKTASCLQCQAEVRREKYRNNAEFRQQLRVRDAAYAKANPERANARVKAYQARNPEAVKASHKAYVEANRSKVYAKNAARYCARKQAHPSWANRFFISEAYRLARLRTQMTGVKHVVDHVIPLNGKYVCGLHVENNLQVIPEAVNLAKSNSFTFI